MRTTKIAAAIAAKVKKSAEKIWAIGTSLRS